MNTATEAEAKVTDDTTTPVVSDERREEIGDELADLDKQERVVVEALEEVKAEFARIQTERRELIGELLGNVAQPDALDMTPEMADEAIAALKSEFSKSADDRKKDGYTVQGGMDFAVIEAKLRAKENEAVLASLYRMVKADSRPTVVCEEGGRYCIAETFVQTLPDRANCVYDRKAEKQVGRENCNGNAVTQSQKMGVPLMERRIAEAHMARFPDSNQYCFDFIQATSEEREGGCAPFVCRGIGRTGVLLRDVPFPSGYRGWRGALWV